MNCIKCGNELNGNQRKYCSNRCKNLILNDKHQNYAAQKERAIGRKIYFVNKMGGKCSVCGYDKNLSNLCFHHTDSIDKDFGVDFRQFSNRSIHVLEAELEKCVLLCHICHNEHHNPSLNDWQQLNYSPKLTSHKIRSAEIIKEKEIYLTNTFNNKSIKDEDRNAKIAMILNSSIDFSKFGWVKEVAELINKKPQKINIWMMKWMPNFYENMCYKRKDRKMVEQEGLAPTGAFAARL